MNEHGQLDLFHESRMLSALVMFFYPMTFNVSFTDTHGVILTPRKES